MRDAITETYVKFGAIKKKGKDYLKDSRLKGWTKEISIEQREIILSKLTPSFCSSGFPDDPSNQIMGIILHFVITLSVLLSLHFDVTYPSLFLFETLFQIRISFSKLLLIDSKKIEILLARYPSRY